MERDVRQRHDARQPPPADPFAAVTHPDPYDYYARLAAERPMALHPELGLWVAAGAAARETVLASPLCRVRPADEPVPLALVGSLAGELWTQWARMSDGAEHTERRARLVRLLATVPYAGVERSVAAAAERLLPDPGAEIAAEALDAHVSRMPPLALAVALGLEVGDAQRFADTVLAFTRGIAPAVAAAVRLAGETAARELVDRLASRAGGDVTVADLVALLWQSADSTAGAIGNVLVSLARRPRVLRRLTREPALLERVVARVLRDDPPVHNTRRHVATPARIAGADIGAGGTILVILAGAGGAASATMPGFGHGPHRCPGAALAAGLTTAAVRALLTRDLDWDRIAAPSYRPSLNVRIPRFAGRPA